MEGVAPWDNPLLMTAEELRRLPDDVWRYELVDGGLVRMLFRRAKDGHVVILLLLAIHEFADEHRLGEAFPPGTGFWISAEGEPDTVLAPDLAFVARERVPDGDVEGFPRIAPDLVVEVVSPSRTRARMDAKARRWLGAGVRLVWVVLPESQLVEVWRGGELDRVLSRDDELSGADVLPGFRFPIEQLFS